MTTSRDQSDNCNAISIPTSGPFRVEKEILLGYSSCSIGYLTSLPFIPIILPSAIPALEKNKIALMNPQLYFRWSGWWLYVISCVGKSVGRWVLYSVKRNSFHGRLKINPWSLTGSFCFLFRPWSSALKVRYCVVNWSIDGCWQTSCKSDADISRCAVIFCVFVAGIALSVGKLKTQWIPKVSRKT